MKHLIRLFIATHIFLYKFTAGKIGAHFGGMDVLLLETVGNKTGRKRTTPLAYFKQKENWIITASNAGSAHHPAWYYNLIHQPTVQIQVKNEHYTVTAEQVDMAEKDKLWAQLIEKYPNFQSYQQKTTREIPMFILSKCVARTAESNDSNYQATAT
ncbi:MAG TPA: nitroreductase family deazaflavin-dependent oxidoreductase [Gammaproteobacteria bacterium]|nr:nitroreductase family deazaflavin-dependent oxidoreductase [Gammaproteobacteria bacterium]